MTPTGAGPRGAGLATDLLLLLVAALALFLPGLGNRDLWNPDEPRYAEVTREMVVTGDYLVPRLNGRVYTQKPPLLFWAIAGFAALRGGLDEIAVRLPSALAAVGTILLVFLIARRLFDRRAAWFAAAAFATCGKILWQGRVGQIDMLLTFLVTLAMWLWVRGYTERRPGFYLGFFAAAGLATLAKGPVGLLPPLFSLLVFLAVTRDGGELRRLRLGTGLAIWAAIVLAWLGPAVWRAGASYLYELLFTQNLTRFVDPGSTPVMAGHLKPWHYFLGVVPLDFLPWSLLLPTAIVAGWRELRGERRKGLIFALCWVATTLVFFSLSPAKRTVYVLTMYPALALVVGAGLSRLGTDPRRDRPWLVWPLGLLAAFAAASLVGVPAVAVRTRAAAPLGEDLPALLAWMVAPLLLGAVAGLVAARRGRTALAAGSVAAGAAALGLTFALAFVPRLDVVKSVRPLATILKERMAPGEVYAIYPFFDPQVVYYSERYALGAWPEERLREFLARPERVWLMIERDDLARLDPPLELTEVARGADLEDGYVLLRKDPR